MSLTRDDKIAYVSYRVNVGTEVSLNRDVSVVLDLQGIGAGGDDLSFYRGSQTFNTSESYFSLYRGYIEVKDIFGEQIDLRLGRQEIVMGDGFLLSNEPFYGGVSVGCSPWRLQAESRSAYRVLGQSRRVRPPRVLLGAAVRR